MNQGIRWVLLMQKNRHRKSHAWAPLGTVSVSQKVILYIRYNIILFAGVTEALRYLDQNALQISILTVSH
jgi:hypothetical protein